MKTVQWLAIALAVWVLGGSPVEAQSLAAVNADLAPAFDILDERPTIPTVNTALIFTNPTSHPVEVKLRAFNHDGKEVGTGHVVVPAKGLRYAFVSRLLDTDDYPFVGWAVARSSSPVFGSAVLVGAGTTDLPVEARRRSRIVFPIAAAY